MAAIVGATVVADVRLRVTVAADVLLRTLEHRTAEAEADRRAAAAVAVVDPRAAAAAVVVDRRTAEAAVDPRTAAVVAADMEGNNTLDAFPA